MKTIDSHAHLLHGRAGFSQIVESGVYDEIWLMELPEGMLPGHRCASRRELLETARDFPEAIRLFGYLDLNGDPAEIDRMKELGFFGLKPYKPLHSWNHEAYYPHYEHAAELRMPILFHTGLVARGEPFGGASGHGFGAENMRPSHLAGIAEAFPELIISAGHLGWPWIEESAQNLYYYPNISNDVSGYMRSLDRLPELLDRRCHDGTERFFNDKIRFATDMFYGSEEQNAKSLRLHEFWRRWFEFIGELYYRWGSPAEQEKFFFRNAEAIIKQSGMPCN
ncbi:MAG: amidohydrolase family protein [Lentisphaeria bacterium]|nr:amidohydrolase family protein [Lentisphaeria bacterium]